MNRQWHILILCAVVLGLALSACAPASADRATPSLWLNWTRVPTIVVPTPSPALLGPQPPATPTRRPTAASSKRPKVGGEAPDFLLDGLAGKQVALSDYRGKVVLVNFFATWCPPCLAELPHMISLYDEYREQGLEVLALDQVEPADTVRKFVRENAVPFTVLLDSSAKVSQVYNVRAIPRSLFIDAEGIIRIDHIGYMSEDVARDYIEQMLE